MERKSYQIVSLQPFDLFPHTRHGSSSHYDELKEEFLKCAKPAYDFVIKHPWFMSKYETDYDDKDFRTVYEEVETEIVVDDDDVDDVDVDN